MTIYGYALSHFRLNATNENPCRKPGHPLGETTLNTKPLRDDFVNVIETANLFKVRFHDLCHQAESLMLNHSVSALVVSKILGHANPSVTLSIYAHATLDMQSQAVSVMDEIETPIQIQLHPVAPAEKIARKRYPRI